MFPAIYFISTRQVGMNCFCVFQVKCSILSFGFCLVKSKCDAYQPADYSLVSSHPKMPLLFFNLPVRLVSNHFSQLISRGFLVFALVSS